MDQRLTVQLKSPLLIKIVNAAGVLMLQKKLPVGSSSISLPSLSKGRYFVIAGTLTETFLVE
jgi:hypothetical protein